MTTIENRKCKKCCLPMRITKDEVVTHDVDSENTDYEYLEYMCPICLKKEVQLIVFTSNFK